VPFLESRTELIDGGRDCCGLLEAVQEYLIRMTDGGRRCCSVFGAVCEILVVVGLLDPVREFFVESPSEVVAE
jgi:hypothetical protein